ncbi:butyrophilin subfamily 3 member A2-like [Macrotis lagotis]|uniref:butyrophilin subfamily 3 member A2-like n=1 Tax=Macrotis lagotis TaxID=92651 RepID=UPI003D69A4E1
METINSSGVLLFKFLISFLLIDMATQLSGYFSVIGPKAPIQTSVGREAVLPCHLSPAQTAQHMQVVWSKSQNIVHRYQNGGDHFEDQAPNYQGRTKLVKDAITVGDVTLRILDVKPSDAGQYKCIFKDSSHSAEAFMELKVIEASSLFETYPGWWSMIGIFASMQFSILIYYCWKAYKFREEFLLNWKHKLGVVILAVFWILLMSFLIYYIVNMSGCRGMEDLDEWAQKDQIYLGLLTFLPLLPTILFVSVDAHGKCNLQRVNTVQDHPQHPEENIPLDQQRENK